MDANMMEALIWGAVGGFSLAVAQLLGAYRRIVHSDNPDTKVFLLSQIIPFLGLTIVGAIVAVVTNEGPISPYLSGLTALGFVLVLTRTSHDDQEAPRG